MGCGGCEAKTVQEVYADTQGVTRRAALSATGPTQVHTAVLIQLAEPGGGVMETSADTPMEVRVQSTSGACDASCAEVTSCRVVLTCTLSFLAIMPDPNGTGPQAGFGPILTFTPPAGGTVEGGSTIDISPESTVLAVTIRDDAEGTVGSVSYSVDYSVEVTFEPGCGNTASYVIGYANFAIDPLAGWTRTNPTQNSPTFEIGCEECKASKRATITQASGKNAVADIESRE